MSEIIRSFIAIDIPQEVREKIVQYQTRIKSFAPQLKWVHPNAMHITLKFLGNQPAERIDAVIARLFDLPKNYRPFSIVISEFGGFPNERRPRVLWLGIQSQPHEPLFRLQNDIEDYLEPLGFEKEKRRFSPHLTMARVKFPRDFSELFAFVNQYPFQKTEFPVSELIVMRSILRPRGAQYTPIQKYSLR